jgi:GTP-binding protein
MPPYFVTSASEGTGKEELLNYILEINEQIYNQNKFDV